MGEKSWQAWGYLVVALIMSALLLVGLPAVISRWVISGLILWVIVIFLVWLRRYLWMPVLHFWRIYQRYSVPIALICMTGAAYCFSPFTQFPMDKQLATFLTGIGVLSAGIALRQQPSVPPLWQLPAIRARFEQIRNNWAWVLSGIVLMGIVTRENTLPSASLHYHLQMGSWFAGLVCLMRGLAGTTQGAHLRLPANTMFALCLIILVGFVVRLYDVDGALRVFIDETIFANSVRYYRADRYNPILQPMDGVAVVPFFYSYFQTVAVDIVGRNMLGLRLVSVLVGTATIPAVYLLARTLFDRRTALLAAVALAVFPPHIHFSRLALLQIADPLFGVLAFTFLARALQHQRRRDFALAGMMFGMTQYFYDGGRLLFPMVGAAWVFALYGILPLFARKKPMIPWRGFGILFVGFAVLAAPIYAAQAAINISPIRRFELAQLHPAAVTELTAGGVLDTAIRYLQRLSQTFELYVHLPDHKVHVFHYGGEYPMLLAPLVPFFLLGVGFIVWRWRNPASILIFLWLLLVSLGNTLLATHLSSSRYVPVYPIVAILLALGIQQALLLLAKTPSGLQQQLRWVWVVVVCMGILNIGYYFGQHLPYFVVQSLTNYRSWAVEDAAMRVGGLPAGSSIHIVTNPTADLGYTRWDVLFFLDNANLSTITPQELNIAYLEKLNYSRTNVFFLQPNDAKSLALLHQYFILSPPEYTPYPSVPPDRALVMYRIEAWR